jgi:hypothetical protein
MTRAGRRAIGTVYSPPFTIPSTPPSDHPGGEFLNAKEIIKIAKINNPANILAGFNDYL